MERTIVLVDDHSLFRNGLRGLLEHCAGCRVVGEAASGEEFLAMLPELEADIVFMDFAMPGIDGAQATERALARRPDLRIITLSMFGEESYYTRMVQAGARGFLLKDSDIGDVVEAIDTVMAGGSYFSPQLLSSLAGRMRTREDVPDEELSAREREILVAVCRGLSNQEIAADPALRLDQAHHIAHQVHDAIEAEFPQVKHCMVHVNPFAEKGEGDEEMWEKE